MMGQGNPFRGIRSGLLDLGFADPPGGVIDLRNLKVKVAEVEPAVDVEADPPCIVRGEE